MRKPLLSLLFILLTQALHARDIDTAKVIATIKSQFTEINNNTQYRKVERTVLVKSSEGAELIGYYDKQDLKKMSVTFYGETGKVTTEYYLHKDQLVFVFEKESLYDKPMNETGSKVTNTKEHRYYFYNDTLIKWYLPGGEAAHLKPEIIQMQNKLLLQDFKQYKDMLAAK